jgi:hypothetical protein
VIPSVNRSQPAVAAAARSPSIPFQIARLSKVRIRHIAVVVQDVVERFRTSKTSLLEFLHWASSKLLEHH